MCLRPHPSHLYLNMDLEGKGDKLNDSYFKVNHKNNVHVMAYYRQYSKIFTDKLLQ